MLTGVVNSGGAIGAGLFIGSGGAFQSGGPGSVLIGFMIVGKFPVHGVLHGVSVPTFPQQRSRLTWKL
jgi:amino acid permease